MAFRRRKTKYSYVMLTSMSVVMFWRGAWGLMDTFLFPNNSLLSYSISLILGLGILIYTQQLVDEL